MNIQQHVRIERIKQFSRYLYLALSGLRYVLWGMWPLLVAVMLFGNRMQINVGDMQMDDVAPSLLQRVLLIGAVSAFMFVAIKITFHFRELIRHFSEGDIFNKAAIDHARKALFNGLVIYGLYLLTLVGSWVWLAQHSSRINLNMDVSFIFALMFFGLMYVLLWALEIGGDLNEESELTI